MQIIAAHMHGSWAGLAYGPQLATIDIFVFMGGKSLDQNQSISTKNAFAITLRRWERRMPLFCIVWMIAVVHLINCLRNPSREMPFQNDIFIFYLRYLHLLSWISRSSHRWECLRICSLSLVWWHKIAGIAGFQVVPLLSNLVTPMQRWDCPFFCWSEVGTWIVQLHQQAENAM